MQAVSNGERATWRMRALYRLAEDNGGCSLVYDLERTQVIEVPREFRFEMREAAAPRAPNERLVSWLKSEGLLTLERKVSWAQGVPNHAPRVSDVSLDMSGACNMGCSYCFENEIGSRIGRMSMETALATLTFAFEKSDAAAHLSLHFGSGEPLLRFDLLQRIVQEANLRAAPCGRTVSFELTTNATLVTEEIASFLKQHPFNVRVSCDGPPHIHNPLRPLHDGQNSYTAVERGLRLLAGQIPDRLTVNSVLVGQSRLAALWAWAKDLGIRHYHVIKVGTYAQNNLELCKSELSNFRSDLQSICTDLFDDLVAGRRPIDYQPITKIVRRLMIPEPVTRFCGVAGTYLGVASNGKVYPCFRHLGIKEYAFGDVWNGVEDEKRREFLGREAADVDSRPICRDCWARYLCGGGCYADSSVYGPTKTEPQVQHCPFWRTEIELAIRFYNQMLNADPNYCLRLFRDDLDELIDESGGEAEFTRRKNCL